MGAGKQQENLPEVEAMKEMITRKHEKDPDRDRGEEEEEKTQTKKMLGKKEKETTLGTTGVTRG